MIRDLYDRSIVAYKTDTTQTVNLVLDTIHLAMKSVKNEVAHRQLNQTVCSHRRIQQNPRKQFLLNLPPPLI